MNINLTSTGRVFVSSVCQPFVLPLIRCYRKSSASDSQRFRYSDTVSPSMHLTDAVLRRHKSNDNSTDPNSAAFGSKTLIFFHEHLPHTQTTTIRHRHTRTHSNPKHTHNHTLTPNNIIHIVCTAPAQISGTGIPLDSFVVRFCVSAVVRSRFVLRHTQNKRVFSTVPRRVSNQTDCTPGETPDSSLAFTSRYFPARESRSFSIPKRGPMNCRFASRGNTRSRTCAMLHRAMRTIVSPSSSTVSSDHQRALTLRSHPAPQTAVARQTHTYTHTNT